VNGPVIEVVEFLNPPGDPVPYEGPTRRIVVTAYRTQQHIRSALFDVPADYTEQQIDAYLMATFGWLGLYEIFDQEERFCIRDEIDDVDWTDIVDEPATGYEWHDATGGEA
jgi:hypothetical protein